VKPTIMTERTPRTGRNGNSHGTSTSSNALASTSPAAHPRSGMPMTSRSTRKAAKPGKAIAKPTVNAPTRGAVTPAAEKRTRRGEAGVANHDKKREQILDVAVNLFFKHGYAGTTIADIADKLGVTKPFVYYYFENKEDLFETLAQEAATACLSTLQFPATDKRSALEKLQEGLKKGVLANITHMKAATFFYRETGVLRAPFLRKMRTLGRRHLGELTALLEAGQREGNLEFDNAKLTALAMGSVVGFMFAWYKPGGALGAEAIAERLTRQMLRIAGARETRTGGRGKSRG